MFAQGTKNLATALCVVMVVNVRYEILRALSVKVIALWAVMLSFGTWETVFWRIMSSLP
jgi:uncharacterized membrane protein